MSLTEFGRGQLAKSAEWPKGALTPADLAKPEYQVPTSMSLKGMWAAPRSAPIAEDDIMQSIRNIGR